MQLAERLTVHTRDGPTVTQGRTTITPQARGVTVRLPFATLVWNRPVAVLVDDGRSIRRIPIRDVTRAAQWGLTVLGIVFALILAPVAQGKTR